MNKSLSCSKIRAHTHGWSRRGRKYATFLFLTVVLLSLTAATVNAASSVSPAASATHASPLTGAATHPIQYAVAGPPSMVDDGSSLAYFKANGFSTVEVIAQNSGTYQTELNTIKALGMQPVIDVELVIWQGGQIQTPIASFSSYFQSLKNAGWEYVASEGGRVGDAQYIQSLGLQYVNYNCDNCGLWKDTYLHANENLWESYYTSEWPYVQTGATQAAALGIQNGILAGVWPNTGGANQILANSLSGSSPSYQSMFDWSYANGIGFNQFCVWDANPHALSEYEQLGFPQIVANLQTYYPPTSSSGGWGWSKIGGQLASGTGPAVCAQDPTSLDVFMQGADHALWHEQYQSASGWSAWGSLGGYLTSSPAAVSPASGVIDVFVRGSNGALWQRTYNGGWSRWENLGGKLTSSPTALSRSSGTIDVFVRGRDGTLWENP